MLSWRKKTIKESSNAADKGNVIRKLLEEKREAMLKGNNEPPTMLLFLKKIKEEQMHGKTHKKPPEIVDEILKNIQKMEKSERELFSQRNPVWEAQYLANILKTMEDGLVLAREDAVNSKDRLLVEKCDSGIARLKRLFKEITLQ